MNSNLFYIIFLMTAFILTPLRYISAQEKKQKESTEVVGEIKEEDTAKYQNRHKSLSLTALGFGPYGSSNIGASHLLYGFSGGKIWEVSSHWEIRSDLFIAANGDGSIGTLTVGPAYSYSAGNVSPFLSAQIGFGYADGDTSNSVGYAGQAQLGVKLFRLSDKQMEAFGSYSRVFESDAHGTYGLQLRLLY
jgi:hypothetical protein